MLVAATAKADPKAVYDEVLKLLDAILNGDSLSANPVHPSTMEYRSVWENLKSERRFHRSPFSLSFLARAVQIVASVAIFKWKVPALIFDSAEYSESMGRHSDFRKFDDILRMVVDCSASQAASIRALFDDLRAQGKVSFGVHESSAALMTCFVYDVKDGKHIHFVDGENGGYCMAAKQLKAQLKA
jgi:hypothetical protein